MTTASANASVAARGLRHPLQPPARKSRRIAALDGRAAAATRPAARDRPEPGRTRRATPRGALGPSVVPMPPRRSVLPTRATPLPLPACVGLVAVAGALLLCRADPAAAHA